MHSNIIANFAMFTICNGCQASQLATDRQRKSKEALERERARERVCVTERGTERDRGCVRERAHALSENKFDCKLNFY